MRRVFSIDSEGIRNACTAKVIRKTAITMVAASDCNVVIRSEPVRAAAERCDGDSVAVTVAEGSTCNSLMRFPVTFLARLRQHRQASPLTILDIPTPAAQPPVPQ